MSRLYCTVGELLDDLMMEGVRSPSEARILDKIQAASAWIEQAIGSFIPETAARHFDGAGDDQLIVSPLLNLTTLVHDGDSIPSTDLLLYPLNRLWANGPYMRIVLDPDSTSIAAFEAVKSVVEITGQWGLYSKTKPTLATVASQTDSATSLVVDSGAVISPGATLLIESEQEYVISIGAASDSTTDVNGAIGQDDDEITVDNGTLIKAGEILRIGFEQMRVLDISGHDLLVMRGWAQTKRTTHDDNADVYVYRTFTVERGVNGTTAAAHTSKAISQYVVPDDIRWLCKQMAGLMLKKADSGFAGRVGNAETGETMYFNEFPKGVIENVKANYWVPVL